MPQPASQLDESLLAELLLAATRLGHTVGVEQETVVYGEPHPRFVVVAWEAV